MKLVFVSSFAVLVLLSVVAWMWRPAERTEGRTEIVWISDDNPVRREQIELFNRLYPQYHLRLDPQNAGMEKTIVQCLAGVGPDVFDCYSGFQLTAFVRSGIAMDCTDAMAERGIDVYANWPCLIPLVVQDGRAYGHPDNTHAPALWFNKNLFDEAGIPYPRGGWTWEEFIPIAQKLTRFDDRGRPIQFGLMMGSWDWTSIFLGQWGASIYNPQGTRSALDSPEAAAAAQFYQDLIHKYGVLPSPTAETAMATSGGWGSGVISLFGAGRGAMAVGGRWWLCILRNKDYANLRLGAVELPYGPSKRIFGGGRSTLVNAKGNRIEGALKFLEYMHGKPWNDLINRQADGIGPVIKYNYTEEFLLNPEHPEEDYNAVWRTALENAIPMEVSPYVNGQTVDRILLKQGDLLRENLKTGAEAMRDSARAINKAIIEQLEADPVLKERYYRDVAAGAKPAWDRPEDAP